MARGVLSSLRSLSVVLEKIEASASFSIGVTKFPHTDKLKEERWCLWLGFHLLWLVRVWMSNRVQAMVDKEAEGKTQEIISNNCPQGHIPSDPLLQSLQKFSQSSTRQGQSCLHLSLWRTLPFQSITGPRDRGDAMRLLSSGVRRGGETRIQLSIIVWGSLTTAPWLQVSMATVWNKPSFFYYYYFYFLAAPTHSS